MNRERNPVKLAVWPRNATETMPVFTQLNSGTSASNLRDFPEHRRVGRAAMRVGGAPVRVAVEAAVRQGMIPIRDHGTTLVRDGVISVNELNRVLGE